MLSFPVSAAVTILRQRQHLPTINNIYIYYKMNWKLIAILFFVLGFFVGAAVMMAWPQLKYYLYFPNYVTWVKKDLGKKAKDDK